MITVQFPDRNHVGKWRVINRDGNAFIPVMVDGHKRAILIPPSDERSVLETTDVCFLDGFLHHTTEALASPVI